MTTKIYHYRLHELTDYINWLYFFHSWGFPPQFATVARQHACPACRQAWVNSFAEAEREKAQTCLKLYEEAIELLQKLDKKYVAKGIYGLFSVTTCNDDIIFSTPEGPVHLPCLRQQLQPKKDCTYLCLTDFINPRGDTVGVFATTVDAEMEQLYSDDAYLRMLTQLLCDRLAEAAAEKMHQQIRTTDWGYAPDEHLTPDELFAEKYQGIRPAVGYPSLPDQSVNDIIDQLIGMHNIGIMLTESKAMRPHASVSGLMLAHPQANYFAVGKIGRDQLDDYAQRRGMKPEELEKYLSKNLL